MCFATFPFPNEGETGLLETGRLYHDRRELLLGNRGVGLTTLTKAVHDRALSDSDIQEFREHIVRLDEEVLGAYGWTDINLEHDFHQVAYLPNGKNERFTISEEARREVLQRLLKLNHERHEEEVAQGLHDKKKKKTSTPRKKKTSPAKDDGNMDLFNFMNVSPKGSK